MIPAARKTDRFVCPTHGGGTIEAPCCPGVLINNLPAARSGDGGPCGTSGGAEAITQGNPLVLIGGKPAAGVTHATSGGGTVLSGATAVFLGNPLLDADGNVVPTPPECKFVLDLMERPPDNLGRFRSPATIEPGPPTQYQFHGQPAPQPAVTTLVTIRGHRVVVFAPAPGAPVNGVLPSVAQVASSLGALSDEQLKRVNVVILNPVTNPDDVFWQQKYNRPGFRSAAASGQGQTFVFPQRLGVSAGTMDRILQHEAGHLIWEGMSEADRRAWTEAAELDRRWVSDYGTSSSTEDFCDALLMYSLVKGTPCEATMRAAFPARFAMLEKVLSKRGFKTP